MLEPDSSARKKQWEGWAREWQGPVFGLVQLLLGRDRLDLVEDITRETFIRAFALKGSSLKLAMMDSPCRLRYVKKIAVNLCRDHWRRRKRHPEISLDGPANGFHDGPTGPSFIDQSASPADKILQDNEDSAAVQTALHQLPDHYRIALVLHCEGLSQKEIAEALGKTEDQVNNWIARAKATLKKILGVTQ